jgi:hypothetical protein
MSHSKSAEHFGNQRKMRAKAKVQIRRSDRKRFGPLDENSPTTDLAPTRSYMQGGAIK